MKNIVESQFKILIIDENIIFRNNMASRLRLQGYTVEFANGGFHLMHSLEKVRDWNLLIFHNDMMDMSALEMISLVRLQKSKTELPILYISKNINEEDLRQIISDGANEFPIENPNFATVMDRANKYFNLFKES